MYHPQSMTAGLIEHLGHGHNLVYCVRGRLELSDIGSKLHDGGLESDGVGGRGVCGQYFQQSMDHPGMVTNPARGQLNRKPIFSPVPVRV